MKKSFISLFLLSLLTVFGSLSVKADEVLYFTWTSVDGSNNILDGTFSFSGPQYNAVKDHGSNWIGFSQDASAVTRQTSAIQAGTHTFVLKTKWTENKSNQKLPKIQIGDATPVTLPNADYTGGDVKDLSYSITIGSSGNYKIKVIVQDGERDKFHIQSLTIPSSAFAPTYAVTATATNGSVTGIGSYVAGATVTLTPNPNPYYAFSSWSDLTGVIVAGYEDDDPLTFTMPAGAVSVTANFVSSPCTNTKTIQCEDYDNSHVCGSTPVPSTLIINSDHTGYAHDDYPKWHGSGFADFQTHDTGGQIFFPITLPAGTYTFSVICANGGDKKIRIYNSSCSKVVDDISLSNDWGEIGWITATTPAQTLDAGDYYISLYASNHYAAFDQITITATSNVFCLTDYEISLVNTEGGSAAPTAEVNSSAVTSAESGTTVTVTAAEANSGYYFSGWTASPEVTFAYPTSATTTFEMPASNVTITANYTTCTQRAVTVVADDDGHGSVSGGGDYCEGASVTVTATPEDGYRFVNWTQGGSQVSTDALFSMSR